jgi:hypothetical protein
MHRRALLTVAGLTLAACMGDAGARDPAPIVFSPATPRQTVLESFGEVLAWTGVEIDHEVVPGENRCVVTVAVSDTTNAEALRSAFLPIAQAEATRMCPPLVALRIVPYTRARIDATRHRIDSVLAGAETGAETVLTGRGDLVVEVKNIPAVERARQALAADEELSAGIVAAVRPRLWMREAEHPAEPPLAAYTAVLADRYRRAADPSITIGVLRSSLPRGFTDRDLRGMPVQIVDRATESAVTYLIRFGGSRQLDDGVFAIEVAGDRAGASTAAQPVGVDCIGGECFLVDVLPPAAPATEATH